MVNLLIKNIKDMNIQEKMQKLHHKYGVSEMANYKIQLFIEDLIKKDRTEQLHIADDSGCLLCIMDNVEGNGLTKGMRYKILAEKDGMYCIIDDNENLNVYGEIFFDKE